MQSSEAKRTAGLDPRQLPSAVVAAAVNHVLAQASWARERLKACADKTACFRAPPFDIAVDFTAAGELRAATASTPPDATFMLSPGTLLRIAAGDREAWREVAVTGDVALGREVSFVAQNLRWDIEEDLSRVFGDIVAHRMVEAARGLKRLGADTFDSWARSAAAYWTEEQPLIARREDLDAYSRAVDRLRDDLARLEARIAHLGASATAP